MPDPDPRLGTNFLALFVTSAYFLSLAGLVFLSFKLNAAFGFIAAVLFFAVGFLLATLGFYRAVLKISFSE